MEKARLATQRIAGICTSFRGTNWMSGGHCSLNSAGTFNVPVKLGGRAADAMIDVNRFLKEVPIDGEYRDYPWGSRYYPAGRQRWQAWGRAEYPSTVSFLDVLETDVSPGREILAGINQYTGCMVYTVAYECYREFLKEQRPPEIRLATVSEPGGKARCVTTGHWWLGILQQPLCHMLREHLAFHPSANSTMMRADQAWHAVRGFSKLEIPGINEHDDISVLSSDLKEATDAVPIPVGKLLIATFIEACGLATKWLWLTDLICERTVFTEDGDIFTLKRGIMMGEPFSKVVLVLLGLIVEEIALSDYVGLKLTRLRTPRIPWRAYHLGGDDHLAIGPEGYLNQITANHRALGSIISKQKHRKSKLLVVYTERVLYFRGASFGIPAWALARRVKESPFLDTVKVRLLSPFTKALESVNDKNVAIGKIRSIARSLVYFEDRSIKKLVFDRLLYKFHDFIKGPHHRTIRAVESLPTELGGLAMSIDTSYRDNLPPIFNRAIRSIVKGGPPGYWAQSALSRIFSNSSTRGVDSHSFIKKWIETMVKFLHMGRFARPKDTWFSMIDPENQLSYREKFARLKDRGIVPITDLPNIIEKSFVIKRLLEQREVSTGYRTDSMAKRIALCWTALESIRGLHPDGSILTEEELKVAINTARASVMVDLQCEVVHVVRAPYYDPPESDSDSDSSSDGNRRRVSIRRGNPDIRVQARVGDILLYGMPSMTVDHRHLQWM